MRILQYFIYILYKAYKRFLVIFNSQYLNKKIDIYVFDKLKKI